MIKTHIQFDETENHYHPDRMHLGHHYFWWHWRNAGLEGLSMNYGPTPSCPRGLFQFECCIEDVDLICFLEYSPEEKVNDIKAKMSKMEAWLLEQANVQGVTSFKTNHGTAFVTTTDFANVADWDAVLVYIKDNEAFDLLERRVSKTAVRGYIEARGAVPSGVNYGTKLEVNVRKPTAKGDG